MDLEERLRRLDPLAAGTRAEPDPAHLDALTASMLASEQTEREGRKEPLVLMTTPQITTSPSLGGPRRPRRPLPLRGLLLVATIALGLGAFGLIASGTASESPTPTLTDPPTPAPSALVDPTLDPFASPDDGAVALPTPELSCAPAACPTPDASAATRLARWWAWLLPESGNAYGESFEGSLTYTAQSDLAPDALVSAYLDVFKSPLLDGHALVPDQRDNGVWVLATQGLTITITPNPSGSLIVLEVAAQDDFVPPPVPDPATQPDAEPSPAPSADPSPLPSAGTGATPAPSSDPLVASLLPDGAALTSLKVGSAKESATIMYTSTLGLAELRSFYERWATDHGLAFVEPDIGYFVIGAGPNESAFGATVFAFEGSVTVSCHGRL